MDYKIEKLKKSMVKITVTVEDKDIVKHEAKVLSDISKEVKVNGFRKGKVPKAVLLEKVGEDYFKMRMQDMAIQMTYMEAVMLEKLDVVSRPNVKVEKEEPFTYTAEVAIMPKVEVKDYKSIKVKKEEVKISKKDIEKVKDDMKKHGVEYAETDKVAKMGDKVEVDFEGFDKDGKSIPQTKSVNHPVVLGDKLLIPGFEEEIVGLKAGDTKEFDIKFPKDYHSEEFKNKKLTFKVKVNKVLEAAQPEINTEFIKKMTGKDQSVEEFEKEIEKNLKDHKQTEADRKAEDEYIEKMLKKIKVELPDALIIEETENIYNEMKDSVVNRGHDWGEFLKKADTTDQKLKEKYKEEAEKRLKVRLGLRSIIEQEKIQILDETAKAELDQMTLYYGKPEKEKMENEFKKKGDIYIRIVNNLTLKELFNRLIG